MQSQKLNSAYVGATIAVMQQLQDALTSGQNDARKAGDMRKYASCYCAYQQVEHCVEALVDIRARLEKAEAEALSAAMMEDK